MIDERWPRVKALFQAAVERPIEERDAFLAAAAGDTRRCVAKSSRCWRLTPRVDYRAPPRTGHTRASKILLTTLTSPKSRAANQA